MTMKCSLNVQVNFPFCPTFKSLNAPYVTFSNAFALQRNSKILHFKNRSSEEALFDLPSKLSCLPFAFTCSVSFCYACRNAAAAPCRCSFSCLDFHHSFLHSLNLSHFYRSEYLASPVRKTKTYKTFLVIDRSLSTEAFHGHHVPPSPLSSLPVPIL